MSTDTPGPGAPVANPALAEAGPVSKGVGPTVRRFSSILFPDSGDAGEDATPGEPPSFRDLNLDQVVAAVTAPFAEYSLAPLFYQSLDDPDTVAYRQEVFRDLERAEVLGVVKAFAQRMRSMRERLARAAKARCRHEGQRWFLAAVESYVEAARTLAHDLPGLAPASRGLRALCVWLGEHVETPRFKTLADRAARLAADLAAIRYGLLLEGNAVTVRPYGGEPDYSAAVERTFEKFRRGAVGDYRSKLASSPELNHVEAQILDRVALLFPEVFGALDAFCQQHEDFPDPTLARFDREIHFYVAYLSHIGALRAAGLSLCYPKLSTASKEVRVRAAFDIALASELVKSDSPVVCNDVVLAGRERILVVSGPNQGGKTTFARMFGQLHVLAALGLPVPGKEARLFLCDSVLTHFEREEKVANLRGKLHDDLVRIRQVLAAATPASVVILNEIFSSTTLQDAVFLSRKVLKRLSDLDALAVCVTFLAELAAFDYTTVSMTSMVDPADPSIRTFKVERRPADGLAHALAIAEKYRVTYAWLKERLGP
ncbi:MAG TPA: hypothetical protein P5234_15870 [Thermoanaerobaculaceae bacterium]|nr:hypothetical protein [Thermoanaerobaculaceae bacterium]HRS17714.1 hypothetical protein [Thermoanaerobaculaceae bacterium]